MGECEYERKDLKGAGKESSMGERRSGNGWPHGGMEREGGGGGGYKKKKKKGGGRKGRVGKKGGGIGVRRGGGVGGGRGGHAERCMRTQEENIERGGASVCVYESIKRV